MPMKASILAALAIGTAAILMPAGLQAPGSGAAVAKSREVFTRKRVNGRWVTGRFSSAERRTGTSRRFSRRGTARRAAPDPVVETAPEPPARPSIAARPSFAASPSLATPLSPELDRVISTASLTPAPAGPSLEHMRSGLEAKARTMVTSASEVPVPVPDAPTPAMRLAPLRITFDLERGTKTVTFEDGVAVSEPFDKTRIRELASLGPSAR